MKDRSAEFFPKVQRTASTAPEIGGREGVLFRVWKRHSGTTIYWMTEVQRRSDGGSDTCAAFELRTARVSFVPHLIRRSKQVFKK